MAGTGFIGAVHVRSARLAGAHVVGVSASSAARAEQAAAELRVERAFASSEELVQADDVDVVHICTPNHLHLPLAEAALAAGKHVICEKPLALDVAGARRLVDAAAAAGRVAAVPFVYRYYPTVREARERVRGGVTGPIRLLHGTYLQDWLLRAEDNNWRVDAELGGASRTFADIGSHWCDLAEFVSGHRITRAERAHADRAAAAPARREPRRRSAPRRPTARSATSAPRTPRSCSSRPTRARSARRSSARSRPGARTACGSSSTAPRRRWPSTRRSRRRCGSAAARPPRCCAATPSTCRRRAARLAKIPPGHPQGYADCFDLFVDDVYAEIRGEAPRDGVPMFGDGLRAAQIIEAVLASSQEERWVDVAAPVGRRREPLLEVRGLTKEYPACAR